MLKVLMLRRSIDAKRAELAELERQSREQAEAEKQAQEQEEK